MLWLKFFTTLFIGTTASAYQLEHIEALSREISEVKVELQAVDTEARIAGGDLAREHQFPYQVGLSIEYATGWYTWCGGSLIASKWVLTAAHCVDNVRGISAYFGSVKRLQPTVIVKLTPRHVQVHHEWNNATLVNDIALLFLPVALIYSASIQPVVLPRLTTTHSSYAYHEAIATGWGRVSDASTAISNDLRYVIRYVESNVECQHVYGNSVRSTHMCIDTTGGKSTCTGDSGGPLVVHDSIDGRILIGLTSFGKTSGCTNGYPAVFTRITSYLDWIRNVSGVVYI